MDIAARAGDMVDRYAGARGSDWRKIGVLTMILPRRPRARFPSLGGNCRKIIVGGAHHSHRVKSLSKVPTDDVALTDRRQR